MNTNRTMDFNRIIDGVIRAARLDVSFYEEVERDPSYNQDALAVVILASLLGAIGPFLSLLFAGRFGLAILAFVYQAILGVVGYYIWVFVAQFVGTQLFKGTGDVGEVQRAFGFAYAPQLLNILRFIPCLGWLIGLIAWLWSIATGFIAIRQSLDLDNTNAALTVIISAIIVFAVMAVLGLIFGPILGIGAAISTTPS